MRAGERQLTQKVSSRKSNIVLVRGLFDENAFSQLVASHEGLRGAELLEELLYLAVLIYVLRSNQSGRGYELQSMRVHDTVAIKLFGRTCMENSQNGAAFADHGHDARQELLGCIAIHVIQQIPKQNGIEAVRGIVKV
jgi:hypothetical protein